MSEELTVSDLLALPEPPQREYRMGIISVSTRLLDELDISISQTDTQGKLRDTGVFQQLHDRLLLPTSYSIYGVFFAYLRGTWEICVESPDLPVVPQDEEPPALTPIYQHDVTAKLKEIRIEGRWQRTYNHSELTAEQAAKH